ncbi:MAG TPA: hypothetical protein VNM90_24750, partial [Haliangium sp.]|nr:hypothetical protein [Haliangium sp.]
AGVLDFFMATTDTFVGSSGSGVARRGRRQPWHSSHRQAFSQYAFITHISANTEMQRLRSIPFND